MSKPTKPRLAALLSSGERSLIREGQRKEVCEANARKRDFTGQDVAMKFEGTASKHETLSHVLLRVRR